jgi:hypothetical protein
MTLEEIKQAVDAGKSVKWSNDRYDVRKGLWEQYYIVFTSNNGMEDVTGLHGYECPEHFYIKE